MLIYYRASKPEPNTYHVHIVNFLSNARTKSPLSSMIMEASIQIQRKSNGAEILKHSILLKNMNVPSYSVNPPDVTETDIAIYSLD